MSEAFGPLSSPTSVPSAGLLPATDSSSRAVSQENTTRPWRIGPWASCVANTVWPVWLAHESQNR
jgi:hypothetical protein